MKNEPNSLKLEKTSLIVGKFYMFANNNKIFTRVRVKKIHEINN